MSTSSSDVGRNAVAPRNAVALGRFFLKILAFFVFLVPFQLCFPPFEEPVRITELNRCLETRPDVIVFGNSTFFGTEPDTDRRNMQEILAKLLPDSSIGNMMRASIHIGLIRDFSVYMAKLPSKPGVVVIPINLHSFSTRWDLRPEYQFASLSAALRIWNTPWHWPARIYYRALCVSGWWNLAPVTETDFENRTVYDGDTPAGKVVDYLTAFEFTPDVRLDSRPDTEIRNQLVWYFMTPVTPEHRKVRAMVETARNFRDAGIRPVFVIMPVDVEFGSRYLGPRFTQRIRDDAALLMSLLETEHVDAVDLSRSLPSDCFFRKGVSDEHMVMAGRWRVGEEIARKILPSRETVATASR